MSPIIEGDCGTWNGPIVTASVCRLSSTRTSTFLVDTGGRWITESRAGDVAPRAARARMVRVGTRGSSFRLNDRARNDCCVDPPRGSGRHHPVDRSPGLHHIADVMLVLHAN